MLHRMADYRSIGKEATRGETHAKWPMIELLVTIASGKISVHDSTIKNMAKKEFIG